MIKDAEREYAAAALYDGGWRAADREQLIAEYELDADEADAICELLRVYEERQTPGNPNAKIKLGGKKMQSRIEIETTKKGHPALWESGGGYKNTGDAVIVADKDGQPKSAVYIRRRGELANSPHALIILEVGDFIIEAHHHREDFTVELFKVLDFEEKDGEMFAVVETVNRFDYGEWDAEFPMFLKAAVEAAVEKATCYHCREPHFIIE